MAKEKRNERTTVTIYSQQYTIVGQEPPEHVKDVAHYVDEKMRQLKKRNPYLDTTRLAVLTAVNIADQFIKIQNQQKEPPLHREERERKTGDE